jgi:putative peptide zinc metalloprotease protein
MLSYNGYFYYKDDRIECLRDPDNYFFVKDLRVGKFYKKSSLECNESEFKKVKISFWDYFSIFYALLAIISVIYFFHQSLTSTIFSSGILSFNDCLLALLILFINVFLHELSHALFLGMFGQKVNRIGFKMNFIFPCVYVDTSNAYLLPRLRRLFVFAAGVETNFIFTCCFSLLFPGAFYLVLPVFWTALVSLLPIGAIRTDGYNIIFNVIFKQDEKKGRSSITFRVTRFVFIVLVTTLIFISIFKVC